MSRIKITLPIVFAAAPDKVTLYRNYGTPQRLLGCLRKFGFLVKNRKRYYLLECVIYVYIPLFVSYTKIFSFQTDAYTMTIQHSNSFANVTRR